MTRLSTPTLSLSLLLVLVFSCVVYVKAEASHGRMMRVHSSFGAHNETARSPSKDWRLAKRFSGERFTTFETGRGACGGINTDSDFIVALNAAQYGNGEHCYETITISYNGKSTQAQIVDKCPGCPFGGLDLSRSLFLFFDPGLGVIYGDWQFGSGAPAPSPSPKPSPKPSPTTQKETPTPTPTPKPTSTSHSTTPTTTSTTPTTTSTSSSSLSSSSTSTSAEPTPSAMDTDSNFLAAIDYAVLQLAGLIAVGAGQALQVAVNL